MIFSRIIKQQYSYASVGDELDEFLRYIQLEKGYKVISVIETKVNPLPGYSDQGFIVLYDTCDDKEIANNETDN